MGDIVQCVPDTPHFTNVFINKDHFYIYLQLFYVPTFSLARWETLTIEMPFLTCREPVISAGGLGAGFRVELHVTFRDAPVPV